MALIDFNPKITAEAKEAITTAFDSMNKFRAEMAASSDKVVMKFADAARTVGWPPAVIDGITTQIQSASKMQIQMMDRLMDACEAQMKSGNPMAQVPTEMLSKLQSWPGMPQGGFPGAEAFKDAAADPMKFWMQMGEQWQKNWAQMMSEWTKMGR